MTILRDSSNARSSHYFENLSGVTLQTNPSGVTIYKSTILSSILKTDNLANAGGIGYSLPYLNEGALKLATGVVQSPAASGVTKIEASYFGLTAIKFCTAKAIALNGGTGSTLSWTRVTTSKGSLIPTAGVSRVFFRTFANSGAALKKDVSIAYFAVGT